MAANKTFAAMGRSYITIPTGALSQISRLIGLTTVYILEANDIVLTQISTRLHFNDVQRNLAGVIDAMFRAQWNVGRLIFFEQKYLIVTGNLRGARHHNPVLGAMMM